MTIISSEPMSHTCLKRQNILITGAAGRIGSATAKLTWQAGCNLLLTDIAQEPLEALAEELAKRENSSVHIICADITTQNGINDLIKEAYNLLGRIDGAVHSAYPVSKGWGSTFEELTAENLHQDLAMQLGGAILFSREILRCFQSQGGGSLVHISSIQGVQAPKFDHYCGTNMNSPIEYAAIKAGIISITRWLAKYYTSQDIRVNCVSPGGILDAQPTSFLEKYRQSCTNIGMLSAEHVASTIIYLLSSASVAINGQNIIVDDGWTL